MAAPTIPREESRYENLQESLFSSSRSPGVPRRHRTDNAPRIVPRPAVAGNHWLFGVFLAPFNLGWSAVAGMWRLFVYVLSFLPASIRPRVITNAISPGLRSGNGRRMLMPRDAAARFKREFEEEYGSDELPFFEGGLAQAHDLAKKDLKFMLIILLSPEHDDSDTFVKETLLDPAVVSFIQDPTNNIILWAGNVLDSEAFQASTEYNCTKFPFSALVCLTPKEGNTRMGIVKRFSGPLSAETYISEMQSAIEKYGAELGSIRAERVAQEVARNLRNEQDSAYERSLAIDRERARQKREAAAAAEAAEKLAHEEAERAAVLAQRREEWKAWRATAILPEPPASDKSIVRVALKMPERSGKGRIVRRFPQDAPMEELYAFVECHDVEVEEGADVSKPEDYEHEYAFTIAATLPREVFEPSKSVTMLEKIGKSANLIVEEASPDSSDEEDSSDDYDA